MLAKNSLALAHQGYDLMDKKRNILLKELMTLIDEAKNIQEEIDTTFTRAYTCLQRANIEQGIRHCQGGLPRGEGSDHQAVYGGKLGLPAGGEYKKDAEAGKCPQKYYDSHVQQAGVYD